MIDDERKCEQPRDPLHREGPVARGAVFRDVVLGLQRQNHPVASVKQERQQNRAPFEHVQVRGVVNLPNRGVKLLLALECLGVCPKVKHHETTYGSDPRQRMQLAQQKRAAVFGQERLIFRCGGHETSSACGQWAMYGTLAGTSR